MAAQDYNDYYSRVPQERKVVIKQEEFVEEILRQENSIVQEEVQERHSEESSLAQDSEEEDLA